MAIFPGQVEVGQVMSVQRSSEGVQGLSLDGASRTLLVVSSHTTDLCPGTQFLICVVKGGVDLSPKTLSEDLGNSRGSNGESVSRHWGRNRFCLVLTSSFLWGSEGNKQKSVESQPSRACVKTQMQSAMNVFCHHDCLLSLRPVFCSYLQLDQRFLASSDKVTAWILTVTLDYL